MKIIKEDSSSLTKFPEVSKGKVFIYRGDYYLKYDYAGGSHSNITNVFRLESNSNHRFRNEMVEVVDAELHIKSKCCD